MTTAATTNVGIRLSLDGVQQVEAGLGRVQSIAGGAAKAIAGIAAGSISLAGLTAFVKGAINAADETAKVAQKTGLAAEQVAGLRLAFEQSGGSVEQFVPIMAKLGVAVVNGNKALDAMGVSAKNADGSIKSVREVLGEVSDKFAGYEDGARKTALAVGLLGEEGAKMLPFLNQGAAALDEYDRIARNLGLTLDTETVKQAEKFNDTLDLIGRSTKGVATQIAAQLLPTLNTLAGEVLAVAADGQTLDKVVKVLGGSLKSLYSIGVGVVEVFKTMGVYVGGAWAAIVAAMSGDFAAARNIVKDLASDISASWSAAGASINRVWGDGGSKTVEAMAGVTRAMREQAPIAQAAAKASSAKATADKEAARAMKALLAAQVSANNAFEEEFKRIEDARLAKESRIKTAREMLQAIERETALLGLSNVEKEKSIALWELERQGVVAGTEAYDAFSSKIGAAIDARNARQQSLDQEQAAIDAAKAAAGEWQKTSDKIEGALTDALMRGFENGKGFGENLGDTISNYFKTTVAQAIASAITKAIMSALASTQWGQLLSGLLGGGGGGFDFTNLAVKAYEYYASGSASAAAISAGAGTVNTTTLSGISSASSGATGVSGGSVAASSGSAGSTLSSGGFTGYGYLGYAALIAAAVLVAENLYEKGYNRAALGDGEAQANRFGNTTFNADPNIGQSFRYDSSFERLKRESLDFIGISEKWADIFSGTTRMAALFGRKLGSYGLEASISGGDADVSGFAKYKGGLFRSNKTVAIDIDQRDAAAFDSIVEGTIESARAMARAMGYSSEAIDAYTGSIRVNMKGAETAEEQSKRMADAMDELQLSLLKAASGGKYSKEAFEKMMEGVRLSIEKAGISTQGIADIILAGMTGRLSEADVGSQLSELIVGGIYNSIASNYAGTIAQAFTSQIITPIFTALAAGVPISQAISKTAINNIVQTAQQAAAALNEIFNNAEFQAAIGQIETAIGGVSGAVGSVRAPIIRPISVKPVNTDAADAAREREQLEREILRLQGDTTELRRRELLEIKPGNRALQERVWALEDEQEALSKVKELQSVWTDLTDSIGDEIKRLRNLVIGDTASGLAYLQSQFSITTAQARALDQDAAGRLPELSGQLAEAFLNSSTSRSDYQARVNSLAASLEETNRITRNTAGISEETTQKVKDEELAEQIRLLQQSMEVLAARMEENNKAAAATASALSRASAGGAIRTIAA